MTPGPGQSGTTRTTRGGGGAPIRIPTEICAANADTPPNSMAAIKAVFASLFILSGLLRKFDHSAWTRLVETASVVRGGRKANSVCRLAFRRSRRSGAAILVAQSGFT